MLLIRFQIPYSKGDKNAVLQYGWLDVRLLKIPQFLKFNMYF